MQLRILIHVAFLAGALVFVSVPAAQAQSTFGTITGTFDQRQVQLGVKVLW